MTHTIPLLQPTPGAHLRLYPVPLNAVRITGGFWLRWLDTNRHVTLLAQYEQIVSTGRLANFQRAAGQSSGDFQGLVYNDSDVYKWLEAVGWTLGTAGDPALLALATPVIDAIIAAQAADGYLNTYFTFERSGERWSNLFGLHELYCAGHLIQAAIAWQRALGDSRLLNTARRFADLICATFGPAETGRTPGVDGHPEIEMALVELYRETGEARYLQQAQYFLDARGHGLLFGAEVFQDHAPFRELTQMAGHAVRMLYLCAGAADIYTETGDATLLAALERLWQDMTGKRMYLTGGVGSVREGEAFGADYDLPNADAYAETCAAIASILWNWRMQHITGTSRYADLLERTLYNGFLAGVALDGTHYCYTNPLASDGSHQRQAWYQTACCPTNIVRLFAMLPALLYSTSDAGIWIHHYASSTAALALPGGQQVRLSQVTDYPWDGTVTLMMESTGEFSLFLRVPGWCLAADIGLTINGQAMPAIQDGNGYLALRRDWQTGDTVCLELPMPPQLITAHAGVTANRGRAALMRGPLVYCVEQLDHDAPLDTLVIACSDAPQTRHSDLLNGVTLLVGSAKTVPMPAADAALYTPSAPLWAAPHMPFTAIPYYAWGNRELSPMRIWLRMW